MLRVSTTLSLPDELVTHTLGILARKRVGKSNAAVVLAEEMYDAGIPWVAVDPKGDWWGVRSSADGNGPGLSVVVFGGEHGDVPLEVTGGRLVADLVAEHRLTCVLDVSEMTKADQRRFLTDFAERLYQANRLPLHVFCEEADEYIPQRVDSSETRLVRAFEMLVKRGGFRGLGVTLVTQRSASLNKDVLTQVDTLIVLQTTGPQDRKAILDWIVQHDLGRQVVDELPGLAVGEAWIFDPGQAKDQLTKIRFRRRRTFDSGATPTMGTKVIAPKRLADVDLDAITKAMADTIERVKADDPKELRRRIASLQREAHQLTPEKIEVVTEVVPEGLREGLDDLEHRISNLISDAQGIYTAMSGCATTVRGLIIEANKVRVPVDTRRQEAQPAVIPRRSSPSAAGPSSVRGAQLPAKLGKAEWKVLNILAQYPQGRTYAQLCFLTGYRPSSSTISVSLSKLRRAGYVTPNGIPQATTEGMSAVTIEALPTGPELLDYWRNHSRIGKGERAVLDMLIDAYPNEVTFEELCAGTGYSTESSTVSVVMSKLRKVELVEGWRAAPDFMEAIA